MEIQVAPRRAAVRFCRKRRHKKMIATVWNGIVGVTPMKTPMAMPAAIFPGSPFRLMNRR